MRSTLPQANKQTHNIHHLKTNESDSLSLPPLLIARVVCTFNRVQARGQKERDCNDKAAASAFAFFRRKTQARPLSLHQRLILGQFVIKDKHLLTFSLLLKKTILLRSNVWFLLILKVGKKNLKEFNCFHTSKKPYLYTQKERRKTKKALSIADGAPRTLAVAASPLGGHLPSHRRLFFPPCVCLVSFLSQVAGSRNLFFI